VSTTLVGLLCGVGAVHLAAYYAGQRVIAGALKALPILVLAATVYGAAGHGGASYGRIVALGLVLSAVGDVSLVFSSGFLVGLSAFFLAHLCYITAFADGAVLTPVAAGTAAGLAGFALAMLRYLWPHVRRRLRVPVTTYIGALTVMAWCAIARATAPGAGTVEAAAAIGATSFLLSDSVLAVNRFARPFAGAHAVVMVTYYAAQMLIARSAL